MREIIEVNADIFPVIQTAVDCANKASHLFHLQHVIHELQMSNYWLRDATIEADKLTGSKLGEIEKEDPESISVKRPPSMYSVEDHLDFISKSTLALIGRLEKMTEEEFMPTKVSDKVVQGTNHMNLAVFNTSLAQIHYEEQKRRV